MEKRAMGKRTVISWRLTWLLLGALLLFPSGAHTQDLIPTSPTVPVGSGARAQGMGGAFIAVADDATAASWNPGGLGQLEKPEMSVVGNYFLRREDWDISPEEKGRAGSSSSDFNYFSFAYARNIWQRNMFFSINYQRMFDFNRKVKFKTYELNPYEEVVTENFNFQQEGSLYALSPAISLECAPGFFAGVAHNTWSDSVTGKSRWESKSQSIYLTGTDETTMSYKDFRGENWTLGFLWEITQQLKLGGVYKTPFRASVKCERQERYTNPYNPNDLIVKKKEAIYQINYPAAYGLGLSYRLGDSWTFAADVTQTRWQDYTIVEAGRKVGPFADGVTVPKNKDPGYTVRLGVERAFILDDKMGIVLPLRFGGFYDPEPSVNAPHDYYGASFGIGIADKRLALDFAYQFRTGPAVSATEAGLMGANEVKILRHLFLSSLIFYY